MLALKGNQSTPRDDVESYFSDQKACDFRDATVSQHETLEKSHGRIETRAYTVIDDIDWLKERHDWSGLGSIIMVCSVRDIDAKIERETRYYTKRTRGSLVYPSIDAENSVT